MVYRHKWNKRLIEKKTCNVSNRQMWRLHTNWMRNHDENAIQADFNVDIHCWINERIDCFTCKQNNRKSLTSNVFFIKKKSAKCQILSKTVLERIQWRTFWTNKNTKFLSRLHWKTHENHPGSLAKSHILVFLLTFPFTNHNIIWIYQFQSFMFLQSNAFQFFHSIYLDR